MSKIGDLAKLESILEYIKDIDKIVERHETIENALLDFESKYALMMCFQQIGELANKITSDEFISKIPVKNIVGFRNVIAHNYDGINLTIAEKTISDSIPKLKHTIERIIEKTNEQT